MVKEGIGYKGCPCVDKEVERTAVAGMVDVAEVPEAVKDGLDQPVLAEVVVMAA